MANLTVKLSAPTDQRWSGTLPVEVRNLNKAVLQARGYSDGTFEVPAGRYLVTATLPDGQQASGDEIVEVQQHDNKEVVLSLQGEEVPSPLQSTAPWTDPLKALFRPFANMARSAVGSRPVTLVHDIRLGTLLRLDPQASPRRTIVARTTIEMKLTDGPALLEIGTERGSSYFAVPVDESGATTVQWDTDATPPAARFDFNSPVTAFFDYVQGGFAPQARTLSRLLVKQAESYLKGKDRSPLQAALAAYVLLRRNELDGLDSWTAELRRTCKWLPDAHAIRMEYLARVGRHLEAAVVLRELPSCSVPWFRSGIVYAAARAKYYHSLPPEAEGALAIDQAARASIAQMAPVLAELAEALDLTVSTTVLHGLPRIA